MTARKRMTSILVAVLMVLAVIPLTAGPVYAASYPTIYLDTFRYTIVDPDGNVKETATRGDKIIFYGEVSTSKNDNKGFREDGIYLDPNVFGYEMWAEIEAMEYNSSTKRQKLTLTPITIKESVSVGKKQIHSIRFRDTYEQATYYYNINVTQTTLEDTGTWHGENLDLSFLDFTVTAPLEDAVIENIPDQTYTGNEIKPALAVNCWDVDLEEGTDYDVSYDNNVAVGTATATITGKGYYTGSQTVSFRIAPANISKASVYGIQNKTYNGKAQKQSNYTVLFNGRELVNGTDYTVSYKNNTNAGTATMTFAGKGIFAGTLNKTFKIGKIANPLKVSPKTGTVKFANLKKKAQTLAVSKVINFNKKAGDKKTYTLSTAKKGKKSFKKYFTINKTTGKVTVKKGLKKGTYKVTVKINAAGNTNYKATSKTVTFTVRVK